MFIEAIIIGLIIGIISNKRVSNLYSVDIRGWYLIIFGVLIQYVPILLNNFDWMPFDYGYFTLLGNIIILVVVLMNYEIKSSLIIFVGGLINTIGFYINGLKFPVFRSVANNRILQLIQEQSVTNFKVIDGFNDWPTYFSKFIKVPDIYPFAKALSIGDIIIMLGIITLIVREMDKTYFKNKGAMLRFPYR